MKIINISTATASATIVVWLLALLVALGLICATWWVIMLLVPPFLDPAVAETFRETVTMPRFVAAYLLLRLLLSPWVRSKD